MAAAEHHVTIDVPIAAVYQQWIDVGSFPEFLAGVRSVTGSTDFYSHWTIGIGRITREFDLEITEQLPEERVAWRTITGDVSFTGHADFQAVSDLSTSVSLTIDWSPGSAAERAAALIGADDRVVRAALDEFKAHVEKTGGPSGHSYVTLKSVDAESTTDTEA
ncbi:SRPBCC family protein [Herbiconiux sp. P15]|uniref:SRPBCC family protein n=1 Tax=Herbiconiux liukaitaii TaxID=3342799 RepID=UPI0035B90412